MIWYNNSISFIDHPVQLQSLFYNPKILFMNWMFINEFTFFWKLKWNFKYSIINNLVKLIHSQIFTSNCRCLVWQCVFCNFFMLTSFNSNKWRRKIILTELTENCRFFLAMENFASLIFSQFENELKLDLSSRLHSTLYPLSKWGFNAIT